MCCSELRLLAALAAIVPLPLPGQSPAFEVASIRLSEDEHSPSIAPGLRNGRLTAHKATLRQILSRASELTEPQVIGPDWLDKVRFDIVARAPQGVPDSAMAPMLLALLEERFKLAAHRELRTVPVFHLTVAPGGVKMPLHPVRSPIVKPPGVRGAATMGGAATPADIAKQLSFVLGRPVIDKTGLTDRYSYYAFFAPVSSQPGADEPEFRPPDVFTAIQKQMGLKLEPAKDAVSLLIVDHIERLPTEN